MLSRIREQLGTAGLIVAVVALVAAVGGSAIAANTATDSGKRNSKRAKKNKKKKQKGVTIAQVRKISKQEARKFANSNPGPAGPQGPAGPAGANGNDGQNGSNGSDGSNGSNGSNGTSANATAYSGPECEEASGESGLKVTSAGPDSYVCNGEDGEDGETGFTATLPSGKTETGAWAFSGQPAGTLNFAAATFAIPLANGIASANVHAAPHANCPGTAANPQADAGHFCAYVGSLTSATLATAIINPPVFKPSAGTSTPGADKSGAVVAFLSTAANAAGSGTFAVTAP